jgi:hypothetical protein
MMINIIILNIIRIRRYIRSTIQKSSSKDRDMENMEVDMKKNITQANNYGIKVI